MTPTHEDLVPAQLDIAVALETYAHHEGSIAQVRDIEQVGVDGDDVDAGLEIHVGAVGSTPLVVAIGFVIGRYHHANIARYSVISIDPGIGMDRH